MTGDSLWRCRSEGGPDERAEFRLHGQVRWWLRQFRGRARAGPLACDRGAAAVLARLLFLRGDLDELRDRADAGNPYAAEQLAGLDGLRDRVAVGDEYAAEQLARMLIQRGQREEAERLRRFGLNPDGSIARA